MTTFLKLASISQVEINRAFSPVWVQESLMTREFYKRGKVMVNIDKDSTVQEHFTGAYVKDPVTGLHEWVCCYDFSSLYPNVMIQFNISPEMYIGKNASGVVEADQIICANGNVFDNKEDSVMRTILKDMYAHRKAVKTKMQEINKEVDYLKKYLETQY
jgi:DNA polymerase elongation subunit (family B)